MKKGLQATILVLTISIFMLPTPSSALVTHYVNDNVSLQTALTIAQSNQEADIIYVDSSGVYNIAETLVFNTTQNDSLSIVGQGAGRPLLDGLGSTQILNIDSTSATDVTIIGLLFIHGNSAFHGGGLSVNTAGQVAIKNCIFSENFALFNGGGANITNSGNVIHIEHNLFENNTADRGGGLYASISGLDAGLTITRNRFILGNTASYGGGAYISIVDMGSGVLSNNFFSMNGTDPKGQEGYNLHVFGTSSLFPIPVTLVNNSFAGAYTAEDSAGTGVHIASGGGVHANIYNNIMWHGGLLGTDLAVIEDSFSMGNTEANVVNNGFSDLSRVTVTLLNPGNYFSDNNISLVPGFVDLIGGNLHLEEDSSAIDQGTNSAPDLPDIDFDGDVRIAGNIVDIGADEVNGGTVSPLMMKAGIYQNGRWYLDENGNGAWDGTPTDAFYANFGEGLAGAMPVAGDWTGTGTTRVGVFHNGRWYLDLNGNGAYDGPPTDALYVAFGAGLAGAVPVAGDWTGTGRTRVGIFHNGRWYLDINGNGFWDGPLTDAFYPNFGVGVTGAVPVTGDWTGTGTTKVGIYRNGRWYLDTNGNGRWDSTPTDAYFADFGVGLAGAVPVTGDWTGTGTTRVGVFHNGRWYLDASGNGAYDGPLTDAFYPNFGVGLVGAIPVTERW